MSLNTHGFTTFKKNKEIEGLIEEAIRGNVFLKHIRADSKALKAVINEMQMKQVQARSIVVERDTKGEMFICLDGRLTVRDGATDRPKRQILPGDVFGEMGLVYNKTNADRVEADTKCKICVLHQDSYLSIIKSHFSMRDVDYIKFLRTIPVLNELSNECLRNILKILKVECYPTDSTILQEGDYGNEFYMITGGTVAVIVKCSDGNSNQVDTLKKGDFFGEKALLDDGKRTATLIAQCPGVECLVLDKANFSRFLGNLEEVRSALKRRTAITTDVRENNTEYRFVKLEDLEERGIIANCPCGRVCLVHYKPDRSLFFALKILNKADIANHFLQENVLNEKKIFFSSKSPFIIRLYNTFKDRKYLYFLQEACLGGSLKFLLMKMKYCDQDMTRFITACIVEALDYLHSRGIVYGDLKAENLVFNMKGYVKLMNFSCELKIEQQNADDSTTSENTSSASERYVDYHSLGILIYEMLTGVTPFDDHEADTWATNNVNNVFFPTLVKKEAKSFIKMLWKSSQGRGPKGQANEVANFKNHKWFSGFDWESLENLTMIAPYVPKVEKETDLSNFQQCVKDKTIPPDVVDDWDADF